MRVLETMPVTDGCFVRMYTGPGHFEAHQASPIEGRGKKLHSSRDLGNEPNAGHYGIDPGANLESNGCAIARTRRK